MIIQKILIMMRMMDGYPTIPIKKIIWIIRILKTWITITNSMKEERMP